MAFAQPLFLNVIFQTWCVSAPIPTSQFIREFHYHAYLTEYSTTRWSYNNNLMAEKILCCHRGSNPRSQAALPPERAKLDLRLGIIFLMWKWLKKSNCSTFPFKYWTQKAPFKRVHGTFVQPIRAQDWMWFRGDRVEILVGDDKGKQGIVNYVVQV